MQFCFWHQKSHGLIHQLIVCVSKYFPSKTGLNATWWWWGHACGKICQVCYVSKNCRSGWSQRGTRIPALPTSPQSRPPTAVTHYSPLLMPAVPVFGPHLEIWGCLVLLYRYHRLCMAPAWEVSQPGPWLPKKWHGMGPLAQSHPPLHQMHIAVLNKVWLFNEYHKTR